MFSYLNIFITRFYVIPFDQGVVSFGKLETVVEILENEQRLKLILVINFLQVLAIGRL